MSDSYLTDGFSFAVLIEYWDWWSIPLLSMSSTMPRFKAAAYVQQMREVVDGLAKAFANLLALKMSSWCSSLLPDSFRSFSGLSSQEVTWTGNSWAHSSWAGGRKLENFLALLRFFNIGGK